MKPPAAKLEVFGSAIAAPPSCGEIPCSSPMIHEPPLPFRCSVADQLLFTERIVARHLLKHIQIVGSGQLTVEYRLRFFTFAPQQGGSVVYREIGDCTRLSIRLWCLHDEQVVGVHRCRTLRGEGEADQSFRRRRPELIACHRRFCPVIDL